MASERVARDKGGAQLYSARASAALTAFTNALTVSLFALIPGHKIGPAAVAVAGVGLVFVAASLLSLIRLRQAPGDTLRQALLLVVLAVTFVIQLIQGIDVITQPGDSGAVNTIAALVIVCFLLGIARGMATDRGPFDQHHTRGRGTRPERPAQRRRLGRQRVGIAPVGRQQRAR